MIPFSSFGKQSFGHFLPCYVQESVSRRKFRECQHFKDFSLRAKRQVWVLVGISHIAR